MNFEPTKTHMQRSRNRWRNRRDGIVLLIVLGMLSLFTVLIVSFVVFSSQMVASSTASQQRRLDEVLPDPPTQGAVMQMLVGTSDSLSAAFGRSLLEDFYGNDGLQMRVGNRRGPIPGGNNIAVPAVAGGQLLLPLNTQAEPQTTLFKFPTNLVPWYVDGTPPPPGLTDPIAPELRVYLDDAFAGRIITFTEGPLQNISFRVIRSFGNQNGTNDGGVSVQTSWEYSLAGNFVIDLSEIGDETIRIEGTSERLYPVAANFPNRLVYSSGPDDQPGRATFDDNSDGVVDDPGELGAPGSDDYGYGFVLNGAVFNGQGVNPGGVTGLARLNGNDPTATNMIEGIDPFANIEFTLNTRLTGERFWAGTAATTERPQLDETWDAADWENLFLAWQPSDHRRAALQTIYSGVGADNLNRQLGQHVIPSFHRPSIINHLMNAPIRIPGDVLDPTAAGYIERTFADIESGPIQPDDVARLYYLTLRLRRATVRPLPFPHVFTNPMATTPIDSINSSDLNGDGRPFDGSPGFSGSNPAGVMNQSIDLTGSVPNSAAQIRNLATWLVNGPWDVDNDGDGLPDSVWVDFNLPTVTAPDGQLIKPMVAPLIEDWDGKINLNTAGSYNQLTNRRFATGPTRYNSEAGYFQASAALDSFGRGGGVGPAEIDFSHLFAFEPTFNAGTHVGPVSTNQIGAELTIGQVLRTRYGNILNTRYGGPVYDYTRPNPFSTILRFPGAGVFGAAAANSDVLARIPFPARSLDHNAASLMGRPIDIAGISRVRKDRTGNHRFTDLPTNDEIVNQPYEFGADEIRGDDQPFSPAEAIDLIRGGPLNGRLWQLLDDSANRNEAISRLLATESRSVDSPELPGGQSMVHLLAEKLERIGTMTPENQGIHLQRMLGIEIRKGSKLNLNRRFGNSNNDDFNVNTFVDETNETRTILRREPTPPNAPLPNAANNRLANINMPNGTAPPESEIAFPNVRPVFPVQATAGASYGPASMGPVRNNPGPPATVVPLDFDGVDVDGNGSIFDAVDRGTLFDLDGDGTGDTRLKIPDGPELLARHLYCLMFALIENTSTTGELVPNFPYPAGFVGNGGAGDILTRNRYVAKRLAQWAVNAVDYRDVDPKCTRLRYDPNPFDANGFDLVIASRNTVWGMERPEAQLTETLATHDKRLRRNLEEVPNPGNAALSLDGEFMDDDDLSDNMIASDSDMDQFRIPEASAYVEIQALAPPVVGIGETQNKLPQELYTSQALDLGRTVGTGNATSPIWRMAVGERTDGRPDRSTRFLFDADRLVELATAAGQRQDVPEYLDENFQAGSGAPIDWTDVMQMENALDEWTDSLRYSADIRPSRLPTDPARTEYVTLADPNLNPFDDATNASRIQLTRFVWFSNLVPNPGYRILTDPGSGMRVDNVFFNQADPADAGTVSTQPALLQPGQYAVVAPRLVTGFGQQTTSAAPTYEYFPSEQRIQLDQQGTTPVRYRLDYFRNSVANRQTPNFEEDATATVGFDVGGVLPIVCSSLYPHQISAARTDWNTYVTGLTNPSEGVDMGFNISAPLPNADYYAAPTHRINTAGTPYPKIDGYRDYAALDGFHPDVPFDHTGNRPLAIDDAEWAAVGTHQEAVTIFLQRLADPTVPWHPVDNPYVTVDFMPMDLTTFNGEEDVRNEITKNVEDPANPGVFNNQVELVDNVSAYDTTTDEFQPRIRFDTRRKIPDAEKDRVISVLVPNVASPSALVDRDRVAVAKRSPLSMTTNVLRPTTGGPVGTSINHFPFEMGAMWDNGNYIATTLDTSYGFDASTRWLNFDRKNEPFRQTLGFLNREYGNPVRSTSPRAVTFGVGGPNEVFLTTIPWMDRGYQSPIDLMNVPASSRTSLLAEYGPGSMLEDVTRQREIPTDVWETIEALRGPVDIQQSHLLGFMTGYANYRTEDLELEDGSRPRAPLGVAEEADGDFEIFTGGRAGFEQIFDYVDTGPVWFDSQRWIDPTKVQFRPDPVFSSSPAVVQEIHRMFNRSVETLQPPYNYVGKHRTPGKINLNTMPDYIRRGASFVEPDSLPVTNAISIWQRDQFLDGVVDPDDTSTPDHPRMLLEDPTRPNFDYSGGVPVNRFYSDPSNFPVTADGFTNTFANAELFGNGSVYRSLAWGMSDPYDLGLYTPQLSPGVPDYSNTRYYTPTTMGDYNHYRRLADTRFGLGFGHAFKAFIESRRGYSTSARGSTPLGNRELDWRYPTRFAGIFAPARASSTPSVQRFMRSLNYEDSAVPSAGPTAAPIGFPRRTHDMTVLRPHPDFDLRTMTEQQRATALTEADTRFSLNVETDAAELPANDQSQLTSNNVVLPTLPAGTGQEVTDLRMPMINKGLFERSDAELHSNLRNLDRDPYFRHMNAARLANLTTHHSNVFLIRMTIGYFVVDPQTGAVSSEYINETGEAQRSRGTFLVDRTVPVGFLRGRNLNAERMILYSEVEE